MQGGQAPSVTGLKIAPVLAPKAKRNGTDEGICQVPQSEHRHTEALCGQLLAKHREARSLEGEMGGG